MLAIQNININVKILQLIGQYTDRIKLEYSPKIILSKNINHESLAIAKSHPDIINAIDNRAKNTHPRNIICIYDANTKNQASDFIKTLELCFNKNDVSIIKLALPANSKASLKNCHDIINFIARHNGIIACAIGSGSVNDMVKYACHLQDIPYICCATALSMNGYLSPTSSLSDDNNVKSSYKAILPSVVIFPFEILRAAPFRLTQSGLADILCRTTIERDWRFSNLIMDLTGNDYYHQHQKEYSYNKIDDFYLDIFRQIEDSLVNIVMRNADFTKHDEFWHHLCAGIILSSLAMAAMGNSAAASQGEHMLAHYINARYSKQLETTNNLHGQEIAITTLAMIKLQEHILASNDMVNIKTDGFPVFLENYGYWQQEWQEKNQLLQIAKTKMDRHIWQEWRQILSGRQYLSAQTFGDLYNNLGIKTDPELLLGWQNDWLNDALAHAHYSRNRISFLDLSYGDAEILR